MNTLTPAEILRKARGRIAGHFFQGDFANVTRAAVELHPSISDNCEVCSLGALNWATSGNPYQAFYDGSVPLRSPVRRAKNKAILYLRDQIVDSVSYYNDHHKEEEVLAVFDAAILCAEKDEK